MRSTRWPTSMPAVTLSTQSMWVDLAGIEYWRRQFHGGYRDFGPDLLRTESHCGVGTAPQQRRCRPGFGPQFDPMDRCQQRSLGTRLRLRARSGELPVVPLVRREMLRSRLMIVLGERPIGGGRVQSRCGTRWPDNRGVAGSQLVVQLSHYGNLLTVDLDGLNADFPIAMPSSWV